MVQIKKKIFLLRCFFIFFLLFSIIQLKAQDKEIIKRPPVDKKPLTLQWEDSQHRHLDKISLIFKKDTVELITNTFSYQTDKAVRLGKFQAYMNSDLLFLKAQIENYYSYLKDTVLVSTLLEDSGIQLSPIPNMPVLSINGEEIPNGHPYYKPASDIIYKIWEKKWFCVECATYKKTKKFIIRTTRQLKSNVKKKTEGKKTKKNKVKKWWKINKQKFTKESLNCIPTGKKKIECIDSLFGAFEI